MSDDETTRVYCTDFGATLDLMSSEKDNLSINNHAVICIFMVVHNWRTVKFKRKGKEGENDIDDETIVNDCDRWIFLEILYQKEKKRSYISWYLPEIHPRVL